MKNKLKTKFETENVKSKNFKLKNSELTPTLCLYWKLKSYYLPNVRSDVF